MEKAAARERIERLKKIINRHRHLYHVLDRQEISDAALDALKKELFDLEGRFPDLTTADSPTQRVGGQPLKEFVKVEHQEPMLSFNDAFSEADLKAWLQRLENHLGRPVAPEFYGELKIDGLAIELVYLDGVLVQGSTRGDGRVGEEVTQNLKTIEAIPLKLENQESGTRLLRQRADSGGQVKNKGRLVVRGEVFLNKKEFERINQELAAAGKPTYANPRNLAAGSIRQLDPKIVASRRLDSFAYDIIGDGGLERHEEEHQLLKKWGFKTNPHNALVHSLEEVFQMRARWEKQRERLPYEIDGLVIVMNRNADFDDGGVVGKAPRAAVAFKFSAQEATTVVEDIIVQVGRTGTLTPVAILRPAAVGGITISRATLHNADEIERLGLKIGDTVVVSRAGDVIPKITAVLKEMRAGAEKKFHMPERCPMDGSKVTRVGVLHRCSNPDCGARQREFLYHFVSRAAFNIEGLGQKIIDRFMDEGLIGDAADIFTLKKDDIKALKRFGEKSADNIVREIGLRKTVTLPRFIYALGITHVGEETADLLTRVISDLSAPTEVARAFQKFSVEDLERVPDIGPVIARSVYEWFRRPGNMQLLLKLEKAGVEIEIQKSKVKNQILAGTTFVLTGTLRSMTREEAKEKIRARGGGVTESISKKTSYVVVGSEPGLKAANARKWGVKILEEEEFLNLVR